MEDHECEPSRPNGVFCGTCGKVTDREGLLKAARNVQLFKGPASLRPSVEKFWETGDASVFEAPSSVG